MKNLNTSPVAAYQVVLMVHDMVKVVIRVCAQSTSHIDAGASIAVAEMEYETISQPW